MNRGEGSQIDPPQKKVALKSTVLLWLNLQQSHYSFFLNKVNLGDNQLCNHMFDQ